jgi:hypothetical protein
MNLCNQKTEKSDHEQGGIDGDGDSDAAAWIMILSIIIILRPTTYI